MASASERTRAFIESQGTNGMGFSRKLLASWGVPWPPPSGWKAKLIRAGKIEVEDEHGVVRRVFPPPHEAEPYMVEVPCPSCGDVHEIDLRRYGLTRPDAEVGRRDASNDAKKASPANGERRTRRRRRSTLPEEDRPAYAKMKRDEARQESAFRRALLRIGV